eukprot:6481222-Alexandrium_andersonii.AAC.1
MVALTWHGCEWRVSDTVRGTRAARAVRGRGVRRADTPCRGTALQAHPCLEGWQSFAACAGHGLLA